jgi:acyl-CoA hydrolase/bacterioferritin (cytochrome b1)
MAMQLKGSKTEENLHKAFVRELRTNANYTYFAEAARGTGLEQIADMFLATARNEAEHAEHEFKFLGGLGDMATNLKLAVEREHEEATRLYPDAAETAREEGFEEIADFFNRMGKVEAKHEKNFHELLEAFGKNEEFRGRTVGHSAVEMAQLMLPHQTNPAGFVHGGELMKLMDNAAGVVAARHSRANPITAMVEDINFLNPVRVGDLVLIHGKVTFTSRSSMEVRIEVEAENLLNGKRLPALNACYVMVAVDLEGKSVEVPPLIVITEEEERLFAEGLTRYQARKAKSAK